MKKLMAIGVRLGAVGGLAVLCTGCPDPNIYGTPRTTPVGKVQHTVAAEGFNYRVKDANSAAAASATLPNLPTYQLRVGLTDQLDIGARVANLSSLGADVKWNFIKSDVFDMAFDPGFQAFHISTTGTNAMGQSTSAGYTQFYGNIPLLFGINLNDTVSFVPTLGMTYGYNGGTASASDAQTASSIHGWIFRGGLGLNLRVSPKFSMQPEATVMQFLGKTGDVETRLILFGLGFNFGALPQYGAAGAESKAEPAAQ